MSLEEDTGPASKDDGADITYAMVEAQPENNIDQARGRMGNVALHEDRETGAEARLRLMMVTSEQAKKRVDQTEILTWWYCWMTVKPLRMSI